MKKNCLIIFAVLLGLFLSTAMFSAPPEIAPGSSISDAQVWSPDKTEQSWPGSASANSYMLYRGSRAELPNLLTGDSDSCARYSGTSTFVDLSEDDPSSVEGRFFWYIVTGYDAYGEGPAGEATACSRVLDPGSSCGSSYCGDTYCDGNEGAWCPDCPPFCGDGICDPSEEGNCSDCGPYCGDSNCDPGEEGWCSDCPGSCGDTICDPGEEGWCPDCP